MRILKSQHVVFTEVNKQLRLCALLNASLFGQDLPSRFLWMSDAMVNEAELFEHLVRAFPSSLKFAFKAPNGGWFTLSCL